MVVVPSHVSFAGAVNSASYYPGVTAGSLVTLYGSGFSTGARQGTASDIVSGRLPESLDGVSVKINNKPAAVSYVSPTQINVQAPGDLGTGAVQVAVTNDSGTSNTITVQTQSIMPAFFQAGKEYVAGSRAGRDGDGSYVGRASADDDFDSGETGAERRAAED